MGISARLAFVGKLASGCWRKNNTGELQLTRNRKRYPVVRPSSSEGFYLLRRLRITTNAPESRTKAPTPVAASISGVAVGTPARADPAAVTSSIIKPIVF